MFTDVSELLATNPPCSDAGIVVTDVDDDGVMELVIAGAPGRVLKWRNGALRETPLFPLNSISARTTSIAAADMDGDGREELFLTTESRAYLWHQETSGQWVDWLQRMTDVNAIPPITVIDRRGTGRYGFYISGQGWELTSSGRPVNVAPSLRLPARWTPLWAGIFFGDRADLIVDRAVLRNTGDGRFENVTSDSLLHTVGEWNDLTVFDADGNGRLDLCAIRCEATHQLLIRQVDGTYRDRATPALAMPSDTRNVVVADFDNDGFEELFFHNHKEPNRLFRMPDCRFTDCGAATEPEGAGTATAIADLDGDGQLELVLLHGDSTAQPIGIYKAPANANNWLRVQPLTRFGAPARGAKVQLKANGREQVRILSSTSNEPVAHFGLGQATKVDSITITWLDGAQRTYTNLDPQQLLQVEYPYN